jgi:hypothetical protein
LSEVFILSYDQSPFAHGKIDDNIILGTRGKLADSRDIESRLAKSPHDRKVAALIS